MRQIISAATLACVLAVSGFAQTAAEQLQKGIFAEQTAGKLDDAITIYRQLANSALPQRDIAAQAQYRLALALLQKGDMTGASVEMQRLAQNYADYRTLISGLAARASHAGMSAVARATVSPAVSSATPPPTFDHGAFVNTTGKIIQVLWMNPLAYVTVDAGTGQLLSFALTSPNTMVRMGMTRTSLVSGMQISVNGNLADDGRKNPVSITSATGEKIEGSAAVAQANTITVLPEGKVIFDRQKVPPPVPPVVVELK